MNFKSVRLSFEKFTPSVFADYEKLHENEEVMKYITGRALQKEEITYRFKKAIEAGEKVPHLGFYSIFESKGGYFIGISKIIELDEEIELGYSLLPQYWRKGYATEIVDWLISHVSNLGLRKSLIAIVDPENVISERLLLKKGFTYYKTAMFNGRLSDYYKLLL